MPSHNIEYFSHVSHNLCSFNATLMLEALREKRMMFVGDSVNRGQYTSLICLLHRVIPNQYAKSMEIIDSGTVFTAKVTILLPLKLSIVILDLQFQFYLLRFMSNRQVYMITIKYLFKQIFYVLGVGLLFEMG